MKLRAQQSARSYLIIMDLCLKKTQAWKSHVYRDVIVCEKFRSQNVFHPHNKTKQKWRFQILQFEEISKSSFLSWRISVVGRSNRKNKHALAAFSNFSGVV